MAVKTHSFIKSNAILCVCLFMTMTKPRPSTTADHRHYVQLTQGKITSSNCAVCGALLSRDYYPDYSNLSVFHRLWITCQWCHWLYKAFFWLPGQWSAVSMAIFIPDGGHYSNRNNCFYCDSRDKHGRPARRAGPSCSTLMMGTVATLSCLYLCLFSVWTMNNILEMDCPVLSFGGDIF